MYLLKKGVLKCMVSSKIGSNKTLRAEHRKNQPQCLGAAPDWMSEAAFGCLRACTSPAYVHARRPSADYAHAQNGGARSRR